jgi:hypothetical protein
MNLLAKLEKKHSTWFLIIVSFLFFLLRLPSLFEPYWYGDEGIYEVIGMALHQGRHLYSGIWDNKPPLLYVIYSLFNGDQSSVRFFSLLFGLGAIITFFFLSKKLFRKEKTTYISTSIFAFFFATPFLEGNIANAENFMLFPILLAGLLIVTVAQRHLSFRTKSPVLRDTPFTKGGWGNFSRNEMMLLLFAGILLGISFLIKIVALFDFAAFFVFLFIIGYQDIRSILLQVKTLFSFGLGFLLPIILTFFFFFLQGDLKTFITSAFTSNVGYVAYGNQFFIPHGFLILKLVLLSGITLFLFFKRRSFSLSSLFILLWVAFALFDVFFSQRPYTHYVLMGISSFAFYVGLLVESAQRKYAYFFVGILLLLVVNGEFVLHQRIQKYLFGYYENFAAFTFQQKNTNEYFSFFDRNTPQDYAIASYITMHKKANDTIFLWGNSAQLYKLTNTLPPGRFIVAYHIGSAQNKNETQEALMRNQPRYIIVSPKQDTIPYTLTDYQQKITLNNTIIYEKVF